MLFTHCGSFSPMVKSQYFDENKILPQCDMLLGVKYRNWNEGAIVEIEREKSVLFPSS